MGFEEELCCSTLGCKMAHTLKAMVKNLNARFAEHNVDLTMEQYFVLNILNKEEGLILQDIADMIDKDKSAIVRHINALEEKYFVARATYPEDKRKKVLILTKPGMKALEQAHQLDEKINNNVISQISKKDLATFEQVLFKMYKKALASPVS